MPCACLSGSFECACRGVCSTWEAINHSDQSWVVLWDSRRELAVVSGLGVSSCLRMSTSVLAHIIPGSHCTGFVMMSGRADFLSVQVEECNDLCSGTLLSCKVYAYEGCDIKKCHDDHTASHPSASVCYYSVWTLIKKALNGTVLQALIIQTMQKYDFLYFVFENVFFHKVVTRSFAQGMWRAGTSIVSRRSSYHDNTRCI